VPGTIIDPEMQRGVIYLYPQGARNLL
jgi:hypothetical protein